MDGRASNFQRACIQGQRTKISINQFIAFSAHILNFMVHFKFNLVSSWTRVRAQCAIRLVGLLMHAYVEIPNVNNVEAKVISSHTHTGQFISGHWPIITAYSENPERNWGASKK